MFKSISLAPELANPQVVVIGLFQGGTVEAYQGKKAPYGALAAAAAARTECTGEAGRIAEAYPADSAGGLTRLLVVGLGKQDKFKPGDLRNVAAAIGRRLAVTKDERVLVHLTPALSHAGADLKACGQAFGEGLGLLGWDNKQFKGKVDESRAKRIALSVGCDKKTFASGVELGLKIAESANFARTLSETPPNIATPDWIAEQARKIAKDCNLEIKVFAGKQLETERLVGHINVGKASENKPCMIRLAYTPEKIRKGKEKPAVLVGKTMTYDTGGLSLKINNGMVGMKRDKDGGCAVLAAMHAIGSVIKPDRPVVALLCAAENSISDEAYRPDDILTYRNGVTVEITNTDAEGRLVLADGLIWACEKENPAYIIDLATLTGGVVVALGSTFCGMFCEDDALRAKVEQAAEATGERVWRLPMHTEYRDLMKSPVADILNSNPNRKAHPIQGAAFLSYFVDEKTPWCHLDIAGVHVAESDSGPFVKGATGWGTRLLAELLASD